MLSSEFNNGKQGDEENRAVQQQVKLANLRFYEGIIGHARILCLALNRQKSKLVGAVLTIPRLDKFHFSEKQGGGELEGNRCKIKVMAATEVHYNANTQIKLQIKIQNTNQNTNTNTDM